MKYEELQYERLGDANKTYPASTLVIRKQFVDAAIEELRHLLQLSEENVDRLTEKLRSKIGEIETLKAEADKVIAEKDAEIAGLKAAAKEPSVPNRTCRKCGRTGTLMYMPIIKGELPWNLYNNKGIDYVFGIQCAHCGEVAFVTKETHEYELRRHKYKRCLDKEK